jgi:LPXTG-site transpeptidase (sortase) family protein
VSPERAAGLRLTRRGRWSLTAVLASVAALVAVAFATGLLGPETGPGPAPGTARESVPSHGVPSGRGLPSAQGLPSPRGLPSAPAPLRRAAPMTRSVPTRVLIPAIAVDSSLMSLGLKPDGTLETPPGAFPAGWFTGAPTPGQLGPAVIVGHVRFNSPGVFARLSQVRHGDRVEVERADGSTARFRVTRVEHFAKSSFPTAKVYGDIDHAGLRLITCGGLDAATSEFEENVVVFADLVTS